MANSVQQSKQPAAQKFNNFSFSVILTLLGSVLLAVFIVLMHALSLDNLAGGLFDFVYGTRLFLLVSQTLAGIGYCFQLVDKVTNNVTLWDKIKEKIAGVRSKNKPWLSIKNAFARLKNDEEKSVVIGLVIGILGAIMLTIVQCVFHVPLPFTALHAAVSHILAFFINLNVCCGFGSRAGRVSDYFRKARANFRSENVNYTLSILGGLLAGGIILAVLFGVCGLSVISGGAALPVFFFCLGTLSASLSASSYIGRIFDLVLGERTLIHAVIDVIKTIGIKIKLLFAPANEAKYEMVMDKSTPDALGKNETSEVEKSFVAGIKARANSETILTTAGVGFGVIIGVSLILAGVVTLPVFGIGAPKLVAGVMMLVLCMSAGGSLGKHIGRMLKRETVKEPPAKVQQEVETDNSSSPELDPSPETTSALGLMLNVTPKDVTLKVTSRQSDTCSSEPAGERNGNAANQVTPPDQSSEVLSKVGLFKRTRDLPPKPVVSVGRTLDDYESLRCVAAA